MEHHSPQGCLGRQEHPASRQGRKVAGTCQAARCVNSKERAGSGEPLPASLWETPAAKEHPVKGLTWGSEEHAVGRALKSAGGRGRRPYGHTDGPCKAQGLIGRREGKKGKEYKAE